MSSSITQPLLTASLADPRPVRRQAESDDAVSETAVLTRRLAEGEEAAFREFHAIYFSRLYRFLLVVARGREHEAQEALQETLLRVVRHGRVFRTEEALWCWLKAVARNAARDGGRRQSRYAAILRSFALRRGDSDKESIPPDADRPSAILVECLNELAPDDRRLVEGKYLEGATIRELAQRMSLTEKAVESRLTRVRSGLRQRMLRKLKEP